MNVSDITPAIIQRDRAKFAQVSPVILNVQSFPSGPADVPIIHSQGSHSPIPCPTAPIPPTLSATEANIPVPLIPRTTVDRNWETRHPPSVYYATLALAHLRTLLKSRNGPIRSDIVLRTRLDHLDRFLAIYTTGGGGWTDSADYAATLLGLGVTCSRRLQVWGKDFVYDWSALPYHDYTNSGHSSLLDNIDFVEELLAHISKIGMHVSAQAIADFMKKPEVVERYQILRTVASRTTREWMSKLNFSWRQTPKGTYLDGHERSDVVYYRQNVFLPALAKLEPTIRAWDKDNLTHLVDPSPSSPSLTRHTVLWFHDQCIFYQNDRRKCRWVHVSEKPVPLPKGEGVSLMVSDFISADYGWLCSPDRTESARVLFRPGANREGYFTNEDILRQVDNAIDILRKHYPDDDHFFIFDNATIHTKRPPGSLSARHMPKKTPKRDPKEPGKEANWLVEVDATGERGRPVYGPDRKKLKKRVRMANGVLPSGQPQSLYFTEGHPQAGIFKGMAVILMERGFFKEATLNAQCKDFKCPKDRVDCCSRRFLFNQPDFAAVKSTLEMRCEERGAPALFLPKFHPELNPIEQCWCYAKLMYREFPLSPKEVTMHSYVVNSLDAISLKHVRQ